MFVFLLDSHLPIKFKMAKFTTLFTKTFFLFASPLTPFSSFTKDNMILWWSFLRIRVFLSSRTVLYVDSCHNKFIVVKYWKRRRDVNIGFENEWGKRSMKVRIRTLCSEIYGNEKSISKKFREDNVNWTRKYWRITKSLTPMHDMDWIEIVQSCIEDLKRIYVKKRWHNWKDVDGKVIDIRVKRLQVIKSNEYRGKMEEKEIQREEKRY